MKGKLSFRHAAGLSLHLLMDNFFRAVITVVLLGVCCAAFGVCICAYGHDYMGTQAEIFRAYEANTVALSRFCFFSRAQRFRNRLYGPANTRRGAVGGNVWRQSGAYFS